MCECVADGAHICKGALNLQARSVSRAIAIEERIGDVAFAAIIKDVLTRFVSGYAASIEIYNAVRKRIACRACHACVIENPVGSYLFLPVFGDGGVHLAQMRFDDSEGNGLFGNRENLLAEWRARLSISGDEAQ